MKISMDVASMNAPRMREQTTAAVGRIEVSEQGGAGAEVRMNSIGGNRDFINALNISQIAQGIMNRAISTASRLQMAAGDVMRRGTTDYARIDSELASINKAFTEINADFSSSVFAAYRITDSRQNSGAGFSMPESHAEMRFLIEASSDRHRLAATSTDQMQAMVHSLDQKRTAIDNQVKSLTAASGIRDHYTALSSGDVSALVSQTGSHMSAAPELAFRAQAHLPNDVVRKVFI